MDSTEFKTSVKDLNWKYPEAAENLKRSIPTIKLYATGKRNIPDDVAERLRSFVRRLVLDKGLSTTGVVKTPQEAREKLRKYNNREDEETVGREEAQEEMVEGIAEEIKEDPHLGRIRELEAENLRLRMEIDRLKNIPQPQTAPTYRDPRPFSSVDRRGQGPKSSIQGSFRRSGENR